MPTGTYQRGMRKSERGTERAECRRAVSPCCSAFRVPTSALGTPTNLIELLESHQDIPWFRTVRRTQDSRQLQLVDDPRRPTVPDAHASLQQRGRAELILDAHFRGLPEQGVTVAGGSHSPLPGLITGFFPFFKRRDRSSMLLPQAAAWAAGA